MESNNLEVWLDYYDEPDEGYFFKIYGEGFKECWSNFFRTEEPLSDCIKFIQECQCDILKLGIPLEKLYEEFEQFGEFEEALKFVRLGVLQ